MKLLVDIGHPGHVHLFKTLAKSIEDDGGEVLFTCRDKEFETELLKSLNFKYISIGKHYNSKLGKLFGLVKFDLRLLKIVKDFKPNILISHGSIYAAHASWFLNKPHIALEDSGNMEQIRLYKAFSSVILTPKCLPNKLGNKQIRYNGYHELAYLGPDTFSPDPEVKNLLKIAENEEYCIFRFVSWNATHDLKQKGLSCRDKENLIQHLSSKMKVFISSENELPVKFKKYRFPLGPERLHDAIAYASIVISEGATIASEAGVLGVPSIYINTIERCYNEDQSNYNLVYNFRKPEGLLDTIDTILNTNNYFEVFQKRRKDMLNDKINVSSFLIWFVKEYPKSIQVMREKPQYENNFRFYR